MFFCENCKLYKLGKDRYTCFNSDEIQSKLQPPMETTERPVGTTELSLETTELSVETTEPPGDVTNTQVYRLYIVQFLD